MASARAVRRLPGLPLSLLALLALLAVPASSRAEADLRRCLEARERIRVARAVGPDGAAAYVRVLAHEEGVPTVVAPLPDGAPDLASVLERAARAGAPTVRWEIPASQRATRLCAPVALPRAALDAESRVVVAAGLNYAAHAEEAGGGDVFLFPKPVEPGAPYAPVTSPAGVALLDYEVELAFVLLADVDLRALPTREELLDRSAFFVANDVTDREPIIRHATFSGPGTGFVEAKGQPGFLPAGPWLVRGTELFAALAACGADGLGLHLAVDEGSGFRTRQASTTARMILEPRTLLARLARQVEEEGVRTPMPVRRADGVRHYPLAVQGDDGALRLPAGSLVLTGTPEGVSLQAPSPLPVLLRGLVRLRGPFEQFRREERARAAAGEPGGYLAPGDRVQARIDGLGTQRFPIAAPGSAVPPDPCAPSTETPRP